MHIETTFILLFVVATTVAIAARRFRIPYTVALVVAGLVLGSVHVLEPPHLTKELLFAVFLPGLLFEAAFHLDFTDFWRDRSAIFALSVPGVVAAIALTAGILTWLAGTLHFANGFGWESALVFAALIAATDPIAVVALFKTMGVPRRLAVLVEGESLLNDGTSIVLFTLVLGALAGAEISFGGLAVEFVKVAGGGALVGGMVGLAVAQVIRRVDDPMIEITLTTIAAYGAFVAAEELLFSGVIATVVAGMLCGNYAKRTGMSPSTRVAVETFWEYVAFALNSIVFLLIGFEVRLSQLVEAWPAILLAYLAVTVGRGVVITGVTALLHRTRSRIPRGWTTALTWGGLRGGLSMVLVLGLPTDFAWRGLLITMTFGVVLLSILLNGLTMPVLLRWLGIGHPEERRVHHELYRGKAQTATAALTALDEMGRARLVHADVLQQVRQDYEDRLNRAEEEISGMHLDQHGLRDEELRRVRRQLIVIEKDQALEAFHQGMLSQPAYERLVADIDARLLELDEELERE